MSPTLLRKPIGAALCVLTITLAVIAALLVNVGDYAADAKKRRNTDPERVASLNMRFDVDDDKAKAGLKRVMAYSEIIGLQEWAAGRNDILRDIGKVATLTATDDARKDAPQGKGWIWIRAGEAHGEPIGFDGDRYQVKRGYSVLLHKASRVEARPGYKTNRPAKHAGVIVLDERGTDRSVAVINIHLDAHVQNGKGGYRAGQPKANARHQLQVKRLRALVAEQVKIEDRTVYIVGDTNFHGLVIPGLDSMWEGQDVKGTHGNRTIDEVYSTRRSYLVKLFRSASDHDHPIAMYMVPAAS